MSHVVAPVGLVAIVLLAAPALAPVEITLDEQALTAALIRKFFDDRGAGKP